MLGERGERGEDAPVNHYRYTSVSGGVGGSRWNGWWFVGGVMVVLAVRGVPRRPLTVVCRFRLADTHCTTSGVLVV